MLTALSYDSCHNATKETEMAKEIVKHRKDEKKKPTLTAKEKKQKKQEKKQDKKGSPS